MNTMKRNIIIIGVIVIAVVGWYLISPVFKQVELQEASPLVIQDSMDTMTPEQKKDFEEAVEAAKPNVMLMDDTMPASPSLLSQGDFKPRAHEVEGKALLIQQGDKKILRFEDFETINGPNLHIYLSSELGIKDSIDLGKIKATKGNVNYELDPSIDTDRYNKVLVWCVPFRVLFSYAELK